MAHLIFLSSQNMPPLKQNLEIATPIIKEIKATTLSSNDIILRSKLPVFLLPKINDYVRDFGVDKVSRYGYHMQHIQQIRGLIYNKYKHLLGNISPTTVGLVATALHGTGECHETATFAVLKLLKASTSSYMLELLGKVNHDRQPAGTRFNHAIVLIGNVEQPWGLSSLEDFQSLGDDVVVVDAFLGYVGAARNYVNDNREYVEQFGFNQTINKIQYFDASSTRPTALGLLAKAQQVSSALQSQYGIEKYSRDFGDTPAILNEPKQFGKKVGLVPSISTYPSKLFDINHSKVQSEHFANQLEATSFFSTKDKVERFFNEPLASYHFKEGETSSFTPSPL